MTHDEGAQISSFDIRHSAFPTLPFSRMQIARTDPQTVALTQLDPFVCDLLQKIVPSASPGDHPAARARIYSSPVGDESEPEFEADWREYVEPDLQEHFEASRSLVERDLATLQPPKGKGGAALNIPVAHLDSWINALNQARLTLAELHSITEKDMRRELTLGDARSFALFQIEFYGELQFFFIRELERKV